MSIRILSSLLLGGALVAAVTDDLTWWQADHATAWSRTGVALEQAHPAADGRVGAAWGSATRARAAIRALDLLDPGQGTWATWVRRPAGALPSRGDWALFGIAGHNFQVTTHLGAHHPTFFMTGGADGAGPGAGFQWDYGVMSQAPAGWPGGAWHHFAITWDRRAGKALWLDGRVAASGGAHGLGGQLGGGTAVIFGDDDIPTDFDETMLWNRALGPAELARLAGEPEAVAAEVAAYAAAQPPPRRIAWPIDLPLLVASDTVPGAVVPCETATLPVLVRNPGTAAWSGALDLTWCDWRDAAMARRTHELSLAPGATVALAMPFSSAKRGLFKLTASLRHDGRTLLRDVATIACWPLPVPGRPIGFFGHHVGSWNAKAAAWGQRFGINQTRGHNMLQSTWWPRVENEEGTFTWGWDNQVSYWERHAVLGQLFGTPWWADAKGPRQRTSGQEYPSGARPRLDAFVRYCETTVAHFKDRIDCWEIWNEPDVSMFWGGSPEDLAELVEAGAQAVKRTDPAATVMGPGFTPSSWAWHQAFAKAGGLRHLDAVSFHAYHAAGDDHEQLWRTFKAITDHFKAIAREHAGRELPLWDTESACGDDSWLYGIEHKDFMPDERRRRDAPRRAAYNTVTLSAMLMELGVRKSFSYLWNGPGTGLMALDLTGVPKHRTLARQAMQELVGSLPHCGIVRREEGRLRASLWRTPAGTLAMLYAGQQADLLITATWPGQVLRRIDLMGNAVAADAPWSVGEEPWYAEIAAAPEAVRAAIAAAGITIIADARPLPEQTDPAKAGHKVPDLPPFPAAMESANSLRPLSIASAANFAFKDDKAGDGVGGTFDEGRFNCLDPMPAGTQTWHGVPFTILDPAANGGKASVVLPGTTVPTLAKASAPIPVGCKVHHLWFLHTANWAGNAGKRLATYRVRYADGQAAEIPVIDERDIRNWWFGYDPALAAKPVPVRVASDADGKPAWRYLFVMEWANPRPDAEVASITLETAGTAAAVLVAGITAGVR